MTGAKLTVADLTGANLDGVITDEQTTGFVYRCAGVHEEFAGESGEFNAGAGDATEVWIGAGRENNRKN